MKIVVDKLPKTPCECPFSEFQLTTKEWYSCRLCSHVCEVDTKGCPHFTDINELNLAYYKPRAYR